MFLFHHTLDTLLEVHQRTFVAFRTFYHKWCICIRKWAFFFLLLLLAEAQGFEPWNGFPLLVFKTSAIDHSAKPPLVGLDGFEPPTSSL